MSHLQFATEYWRTATRPAAQISDHLGFVTPARFGKHLMQRTGRSPIDFRKGIRGLAASESHFDHQGVGSGIAATPARMEH
ncbi:hypothetical protein [Streptomyces hyaluromycini]|uniref:hypothetical protein n=1 Tax=Streptomyces hyaluromycini TaxID=1377993 RepID=UPI000B5C5ACA|nr:hypothetical protein [Streptomyces hyaluromycini]